MATPFSRGARPRRPTTVPVASRDAAASVPKARPRRLEMLKGDIVGVTIFISVVLVVLIAIAVPLRNYYNGRAEIARLEASIQAKEQQKADLQAEIDRYNDPDYVKQQARRRLGMMEPGETAWRIIDPRMDVGTVTTDRDEEIAPDTPWTSVMWDALREIPEAEHPAPEPADMPVQSPEAPPEEPAEQPAP